MFKPHNETPEEKAKRIGVPVIQPLPPMPMDPNPTIAICGQCGLELKSVMHFSCQNANCPVQLRPRW